MLSINKPLKLASVLTVILIFFTAVTSGVAAQETPPQPTKTADYGFTYKIYSPVHMSLFISYTDSVSVTVSAIGRPHSVYTVDKNPTARTTTVTIRLDDPDIYTVSITAQYPSILEQTAAWGIFQGENKIPAGGAESFPVAASELRFTFRIISEPEPRIPKPEEYVAKLVPLLDEKLADVGDRIETIYARSRAETLNTNLALLVVGAIVAVMAFKVIRMPAPQEPLAITPMPPPALPAKHIPKPKQPRSHRSHAWLYFMAALLWGASFLLELPLFAPSIFIPETLTLLGYSVATYLMLQVLGVVSLLVAVGDVWRAKRKRQPQPPPQEEHKS